jgi:succinate dehydrogenase hydrophobic anchor subunit
MDPIVDDKLLWQRKQRWSAAFALLILLHALVGMRLIQLYYTDKMGFEVVVGFGMPYFIPLLMVTVFLTFACWINKRQYDEEWRKRGHTK